MTVKGYQLICKKPDRPAFVVTQVRGESTMSVILKSNKSRGKNWTRSDNKLTADNGVCIWVETVEMPDSQWESKVRPAEVFNQPITINESLANELHYPIATRRND